MHLCLFDIDGTLLNSGGARKAVMESALAAEFGLGRVQQGVPYSGRPDRAIGYDLPPRARRGSAPSVGLPTPPALNTGLLTAALGAGLLTPRSARVS